MPNAPLYVVLLQPPPVVAQVGIQNDDGSGDVTVSLLFKTLLDVDGPFTLAQDNWIVTFIGATQHVHLTSPEDVAALVAPFIVDTIDLDDLANVDTTGKANGYVLYWDTAVNPDKWKAKALAISDFVTGTPSSGDVVTWNGSAAEWDTPSTPTTSFEGASIGTYIAAYNNTGGKVTSGASSFTIVSGVGWVRLLYQAAISSGAETSFAILKNGVPVAVCTYSAYAGGSNSAQVISPVVGAVPGDVFTYTGGTLENFSIQIW